VKPNRIIPHRLIRVVFTSTLLTDQLITIPHLPRSIALNDLKYLLRFSARYSSGSFIFFTSLRFSRKGIATVKRILGVFLVVFLSFGCEKDESYKQVLTNPETYQAAMKQLTDVIVYDIFSPPVASRIYAYPNLAAFEVIRHTNPSKYQTLAGQLNGLTETPNPPEDVNLHLASLHAFLTVGKALIFSEEKIQTYIDNIYSSLEDQGLPGGVKKSSLAYGDQVAQHILSWADKDMY